MDSERSKLHNSQRLFDATERLLASTSVSEQIDCIMKSLQECFAWDRGWLGLIHKDADILQGVAWFGENVPPEVVMNVIPLEKGIQNPALFPVFEKKPIVVDDPLNDPRCSDFRDRLAALGTKCFVNVPILGRDEVVGVIGVDRTKEALGFTPEDVELVSAFASLAGLAIENARLYERAIELSVTDDLTGLHNTRFLREQMARELASSQRSGQPLSILMVDVDDLKHVNDRFGHLAGDELLTGVGRAIRSVLRPSDVVTRYGGDEFVVLLPETTGQAAHKVAERIAQSIADLSPTHGEVQATVSIGIALYPSDGATQDELFHRADGAMLEAKRVGGNRIRRAATGGSNEPA